MPLTAYFRRSDPEALRIARLSRRIAMPLWEPFLMDGQGYAINRSLRVYRRRMAERVEVALRDLGAMGGDASCHHELRDLLSRAHRLSRHEAKLEDGAQAIRAMWRQIFVAAREFVRTAEIERLERDRWFSDLLPECPDPGPVLKGFCDDVADVMRLVDWAYGDAIGSYPRVHANIQLETEEVLPPTLQEAQIESQVVQILGQVGMEIAESSGNPYPPGPIARARRVTIVLPYPCGLHTAFGFEGVLAHELGVHLYEQLFNPRGPLFRGPWLGFSEGFVDKAILRLLRDAAHGQNGVEHCIDERVYLGADKRYADRLDFDAPSLLDAEQRANWKREIRAGRRFYDNLVKLGSALSEAERDGRTEEGWARRIALRLNVLDLDRACRKALLLGGNMLLEPRSSGFDLKAMPDALQLLGGAMLELGRADDLDRAGLAFKAFLEDTEGFLEHLNTSGTFT